jgi:hypothetical protein
LLEFQASYAADYRTNRQMPDSFKIIGDKPRQIASTQCAVHAYVYFSLLQVQIIISSNNKDFAVDFPQDFEAQLSSLTRGRILSQLRGDVATGTV